MVLGAAGQAKEALAVKCSDLPGYDATRACVPASVGAALSGGLSLDTLAQCECDWHNKLNANAAKLNFTGCSSTNIPYMAATSEFTCDSGLIFNATNDRLNLSADVAGEGYRLTGSGTNGVGYSLYGSSTNRGTLGLAVSGGQFSNNAQPGDIVLRAVTGNLWLQSGTGQTSVGIGTGNQVFFYDDDIIANNTANRGFFFQAGDLSTDHKWHAVRFGLDGPTFDWKLAPWMPAQQRVNGIFLHTPGSCGGNCQDGPFMDAAWMQMGAPTDLSSIGCAGMDNGPQQCFGAYGTQLHYQSDEWLQPVWSIKATWSGSREYRGTVESISNNGTNFALASSESWLGGVPDPPQRSGWAKPALGALTACSSSARRTCDGAGAGAGNNRGLTATSGNESSWIPWDGTIGGCRGSTSTSHANEACDAPANVINKRVWVATDFESYTYGDRHRPWQRVLASVHSSDSGGTCGGDCIQGARTRSSPLTVVDFPSSDGSGGLGYKALLTFQKFCWDATPGGSTYDTEKVCTGTTTTCTTDTDCTSPAECDTVRKHCGSCSGGQVCAVAPPGADVINVYVSGLESQTTTANSSQMVRRNRVPVDCSSDAQCEGDTNSCTGGKCIRTWVRFDAWLESTQPSRVNETSQSYAATFSPDGVSPVWATKRFAGHTDNERHGATTGLTPQFDFWNDDVLNGFAKIKTAVDGSNGGTYTITVHKSTGSDDSPTGDVDALKVVADANGAILNASGGGVTQTNLGTPIVGAIRYCSDCTVGSGVPCTSGGNGTFAFGVDSVSPAWKCL